jgi:hypothetical protein
MEMDEIAPGERAHDRHRGADDETLATVDRDRI